MGNSEITDYIVNKYQPAAVALIGSRANGTAKS